ncbi:MAG: hypothetical protein WCO78_01345 [Candidatus Roizmanbacteria bacterium]
MSLLDALSSKKTLIYVDRQSLSICSSDNHEQPPQVAIPTQAIHHLEVVDPDLLKSVLATFVSAHDMKGPLTLVLSTKITFEMSVFPSNAEEEIRLKNTFLQTLPFSPTDVSTKYVPLRSNGGHLLVAANKRVYETLVHGLAEQGIKVSMVVPEIAFEIVRGNKIPLSSLMNVLEEEKRLGQFADFLHEKS